VTSYTKWDRDGYIERVGGPEEAERRRKALMARQGGQRLAGKREQPSACPASLRLPFGRRELGAWSRYRALRVEPGPGLRSDD